MFLPNDVFQTVVDSAPLISIDLIVEDHKGQFLLGKRNNKPAQNSWFVPGGRVLKNENLDSAFVRLCKEELNLETSRNSSEFMGVFEHFYEDSIFGEEISTHYIVLAHKIRLEHRVCDLPKCQHNDYKWYSSKEILSNANVHKHTKWYFLKV